MSSPDDDELPPPGLSISNPELATAILDHPEGGTEAVKILSTFGVWLKKQQRKYPHRRSWAPARKAIRDFLRVTRVKRLKSLRSGQFEQFLDARLEEKNISRESLKKDFAVLGSFFAFACRRHGINNPFVDWKLKHYPDCGSKEKTRVRRILRHDEWLFLAQHIRKINKRRFKLPARERVLLYATAIMTGLRASECRRLRYIDLHDDVEKPYLELCGRGKQRTKNGQAAKQYLQPWLATALLEMVRDRPSGIITIMNSPTDPLFRMTGHGWRSIAETLGKDLAAARLEYQKQQAAKGLPVDPNFLSQTDTNGDVLDFHALRHTCGAWLVWMLTDPKTVQIVMRHSSIQMTLDTYGHMYPGNDWQAVMRLPVEF